MWPFSRQKEEVRESQPFTDALVAAIGASAAGSTVADPGAIGALEAASGLYAAAFASARLTPDVPVLTPAVRALMARNLIRRGEDIHLIDIESGIVRLFPVGSWDVRGGWQESSWFVRADLFGPSGNITRFVPHSMVCHTRYSVDSSRPWFGLSPMAWARHTGALAGNLELRLGEETGGPTGFVIPVPEPETPEGGDDDPTVDPLVAIATAIKALKGSTHLVPSTASGWSGDVADRPMQDWKPSRIGADPPVALSSLRTEAGRAVLNACQIPWALMDDSDGTSQRESWRRWAMGPLAGLARVVEAELSLKLETLVRFDFSGMWAHDAAGRASAFKSLATGGMELAEAARLSGVLMDEAA